MPDKLCFLVCEDLFREVAAVVESEKFDDVVIHMFPANHGRSRKEWDGLREAILACEQDCNEVYLLGGACLAGLQAPPDDLKHCRFHKTDGCFSLFVSRDAVEEYLQTGAYLLTPGWLADWQKHMDEWGFDQLTAQQFFAESATRLLLLDTGDDAASAERLAEFAGFVGRPFQIVRVGLDFARLFLSKTVLAWRLEQARSKSAATLTHANRRLADYAVVLDLIGHLPEATTEAKAIENILELFTMLCAPTSMVYIPFVDGQPGNALSCPVLPTSSEITRIHLAGLQEDYTWTDSGDGFLLRIHHRGETLGLLEIKGLAFPEHRQHYLNLALAIVQVCGLAIANARAYQDLQNLIKQLEQALAQRQQAEEALRQLYRVSQALAATLDLPEVVGQLAQVVIDIVGAEASSIWLWDSEGAGRLICKGAGGPDVYHALIDFRLGPGQGVVGWVAQHGRNAIVAHVPDDPRFSSSIDIQIGFQTHSLLAVPLWQHDAVIGVLEAVNKVNGEFDGRDLSLMETLAGAAAIAINNAQLVETQRQFTAALQARTEELDAFSHTVAHDLKNPLSTVMGLAEVLIEDGSVIPDGERQQILQILAQGAHKMDNIIDELLLLAQVHNAEVTIEPLDMAGIVAEARQRLADMIKDHQAQITLPDISAWPVAVGHPLWVEEVWVNYLSNAIKYGGLPPHLEIGADPLLDLSPFAGESGDGSMVRFWVRDNGPGIPLEAQTRLFTPFTRLNQAQAKGHGLGLSIVRRIVERLGGRVGVESHAGEGSVFYFTLPGKVD